MSTTNAERYEGKDIAELYTAYRQFKGIANELFDMLELTLAVALTPEELHRARHQAIDLLERVERDVKDR